MHGVGRGSAPTVLVVDGMRAYGESLAQLLDDAGAQACHAVAADAVEAVADRRPAALVLDAELDEEVLATLADAARASAVEGARVLLLLGDRPAAPGLAAALDAETIRRDDPWPQLRDRIVHGSGPRSVSGRSRPRPGGRRSADALVSRLTTREREVLAVLLVQSTDAAVARRLGISHRTVRTHVANILLKLGLRNRMEAVALGFRAGVAHDAGDTAEGDRGVA